MPYITADLAISVDGYSAGVNQRLDSPFGDGPVDQLHRWMFETPDENSEELAAITAADAFIMGRNMFSPGRGAWDPEWRGWWGEDPPYHKPVFVLTHHERDDLPMQGGTTFHFVTGGVEEALKRAVETTSDGTIAIAGGATTINQFLAAGLIDELRLHIAPVTVGAGPRLFDGVAPQTLRQVSSRSASLVTHITYKFEG
ncbi:dihydrofolate reductase family protein [Actinoplanes sp. TRM 88003]|uniref:Dihydrofolate reductase family protein n=1 Tax=Paractinoplanes aksuensis TaxID=2939490 RepID=A0ABT1DEZ8_9ACTN|nr:dihydrofolate reductase family protein [Actinoplanes aksuensis]MCO8269053.1 dihydrofolate reductase family protein [Actinoplanes aksuensis]